MCPTLRPVETRRIAMQSRGVAKWVGRVRFYTPGGFPVSASRAIVVGAELVDSISLVHGLEKVNIAPGWWRRICNYTRYAKCTGASGSRGLDVLVIVDPGRSGAEMALGADLVYEIDSRRGAVLRVGGTRARAGF